MKLAQRQMEVFKSRNSRPLGIEADHRESVGRAERARAREQARAGTPPHMESPLDLSRTPSPDLAAMQERLMRLLED